MTDPVDPMTTFVALCAEGARRFGDDPRAIANFVENEIARLSQTERRQLKEQLTLLTDGGGSQKPTM
ncbi:hypothetical protein FHX08_004357 [Rhizobium sp. BK529]|uniref:hypothetical protein n=1 Tax=unclassified Rhizobium TaxID=2613769 RepID=UPI00104EF0D4|nr:MULTISPECIES: hypothetical protein [unclassified Rhizobium]MBB3593954.1 hypothetical protein [Rhizobium sp. BK529]TCS01410.1 hypothetical protein EV281_106155 [Rhizobium sp. BK418]